MSPLGDHLGGERNIRGDNQISARQPFHDFIIRHVQPRSNPQGLDIFQTWRSKRLIGHQCQKNSSPLRGSKKYLFNYLGTGVSIDPDLHSVTFC